MFGMENSRTAPLFPEMGYTYVYMYAIQNYIKKKNPSATTTKDDWVDFNRVRHSFFGL